MPGDIDTQTPTLLTFDSSAPRKIGLLTNPNSHRNRAHPGDIAAIVANHPAIDHRAWKRACFNGAEPGGLGGAFEARAMSI